MDGGNWGHCKDCEHFGSPADRPLEREEARCRAPALERFNLRVYGSNGCNQYELRSSLASPHTRRVPDSGLGAEEGTLQ